VASALSKDVADAAHRVQKSRAVVHVESSAEPGDRDVDHIRHRVAVDPPDRCEEPIAVEHLILVPQEMLEDAELQRREVDRAIAAANLVSGDIHHQIGAVEDLAAAPLAPPKKRTYPREELVVCEWLNEIVVGPRIKPGDAVGNGVARGEHQDRQIRSVSQAPADLHSVDPREHDVEDDEIRRPIARGNKRAWTIRRGVHGVALVDQSPPQRRCEASVVVDHEDAFAGAHAGDDGVPRAGGR
jgi:hypothetical protein